MGPVRAVSPEGVLDALMGLVRDRRGRVRVAVDGAPAADPHRLGADLVTALAPRSALHVRSDHFWRPAGQRFEHGREDPDAWLDDWLDGDALRREVLGPAGAGTAVLPALRDPLTDRSARATPVALPDDGVVVVSGSALLGRGLRFDLAVHLRLTSAALVRRTPADQAWTLPALARYTAERDPEGAADLVVRADDPLHPAIVLRPGV